ncbi:MAG: methionyl-tRNA formyltransferase [Candidatus Omnitrophota bacterium]
MKIIFFGTSNFALPALKALIDSGHEVALLVTQPDRKSGRNLAISPPPTKVFALSRGVTVYQPEDASGSESIERLKKVGPDIFVVVSFGQILKREVLSIPKLYAVNLHGSLLPGYRGAAPTNRAVMNGDEITGVTVIRMNERMDEGDIMAEKEVGIGPEDTNITLSEKLSEAGAILLVDTLRLIEDGKAHFEKQDPEKATYAPKLRKEEGLIRWDEPAAAIHNKVRGLIPWPGAYTHYGRKTLKILKTALSDASSDGVAPGEVIASGESTGIVVATGSGAIKITHLQVEGKKVLDSAAFLRGHRLSKGTRFE